MAVSTGNKRQQVTLPQECWDSLQDEAQRQGLTVSQVVQGHVEASQAHALSEAQQTVVVLQQVLTQLHRLVDRFEVMQKFLETLTSRLPVPAEGEAGAALPETDVPLGPQPPVPVLVRRRWFGRPGR